MKKDVITIYRELHQIPELGYDLPATLHYIETFLSSFSCSIEYPSPASLCAFFDFHQSSTLAYRADMDALPIEEAVACSYTSLHSCKMHACGHDGHMAILLDFAQYVASLKTAKHNVLLIFQPGEETNGGAKQICESGIFQRHRVLFVYGLHLWPGLPTGRIATKAGNLMASSKELHLHIYGKSTHIAQFNSGIDALAIGHEVYQRLIKHFLGDERYLLKFGVFQSGAAANCISSYTLLKGSLRCYDYLLQEHILKEIRKQCKAIEKETGSHIELYDNDGYPALINDPILYAYVSSHISIQSLDKSNFLTDDFAYYLHSCPGIYFYLGTGKDIPLHSDHFRFEETTLAYGTALYQQLLNLDYKSYK